MQWSKRQWEAISERNKNLLVSAAAGSGKTAVLVERIKGLLLSDRVLLSEMLIVTFSNAAAAEMREKIVAALQAEMEKQDCSPEKKRFLREQLNSMHRANISTFHAFAMEVIRRYFYLIDAEPNFRICDDGQKAILQDQAMEQLFQQEFEEKRPEFIRFLDWYATAKSEQDVKDMISYVYEFIQSMPEPFAWLWQAAEALCADERQFCRSAAFHYLLQQTHQKLLTACGYCQRIYDRLEEEGVASLLPKAQADLELVQRACDALKTALAKAQEGGCDTIEEALCASFESFATFRAAKDDKAAYEPVKEEIDALRKRAKDLYKQAAELSRADLLQQQVASMNETAWAAKELYRLTQGFDELFCHKKQEKGLLDFSDIEHYALRILRKKEAADEYRKAFTCIFIDEYQDSNVIQEELISCISRENNVFMVGDVKQSIYKFRLAEPELFLHKYEAYGQEERRYRRQQELAKENRAEAVGPAVAASEEMTVQQPLRSRRIDLNLNFRCKGGVIAITNQVFQGIMTKQSTGIIYDEDAALHKGVEYSGQLEYPALLHIVDVKNSADGVDPQIAELAEAEVEAMQAASLVKQSIGTPIYDCKKQCVRPLRKRDIVILLRGVKRYGDLYVKAFSEAGIESFMDDSDGYFDTLEIRIFLNLLRVVDNKRQDAALLSVLRSPVFGFTISQLAEIRAQHREGSYFDALCSAAQRWHLASEVGAGQEPGPRTEAGGSNTAEKGDAPGKSEEEQRLFQRCSKVLQQLSLWREKASFLPLSDFLQLLISETGYGGYISAIAGGTQRLANVNAMVDKAIQYEASSGKGLFGFIRYMEALQKEKVKTAQVRMVGENDDVVRIMTIHKSKGLEFPFVLIGGLGRRFHQQGERARVACHKDLGLGMRWVAPEEHAYRKTLLKQLIDQKMLQDNRAEEIRILYVGFTRAMDRLLLLAGVKDSSRFREGKFAFLPEDVQAADSYLTMIFPWIDASAAEICYSDRSLLSAEQRQEDSRRAEIGQLLLSGCSDSGCPEPLKEEIQRRMAFVYEDSGRSLLKTKYTVSELAAAERSAAAPIASENSDAEGRLWPEASGGEEDWRQALSIRPVFLEAKQMTAADRGTIYHRVMECLPFDRQWSTPEVKSFIEGMVRRELLTAEEAKLLRAETISRFFCSPLGQRVVAAQKKQKEVSFNLKMQRDGLPITVQGTIDCYFQEGEDFVLLDYKSNYVDGTQAEAVQRIVQRYRPQLWLYQQALSQISGRRVKQMYLYLFSAGKAVEIEEPPQDAGEAKEEKRRK